MLDPVFVRENPELVDARLRSRGMDPSADLAALAGLALREGDFEDAVSVLTTYLNANVSRVQSFGRYAPVPSSPWLNGTSGVAVLPGSPARSSWRDWSSSARTCRSSSARCRSRSSTRAAGPSGWTSP